VGRAKAADALADRTVRVEHQDRRIFGGIQPSTVFFGAALPCPGFLNGETLSYATTVPSIEW
jgi:hypothetical protein